MPIRPENRHRYHQPEHSTDDNLMALRQRCHLAYDAEHHRHTAAATRRAALKRAGQLILGGEL